ncbi:MAG TPA: tetratricopeptide repeat protein [Casimicrobiaceae bacterium]
MATLLAEATERSAAGDHAGSLRAYREAAKLAPQRAELWHNIGALCAAQGAHEDALQALAEAARLRSDWPEPWHARGHVLHSSGDLEGARVAFESALACDPAHIAARLNLAVTLDALQRYSEALPHLLAAREQAPADENIGWLLRASLLRLRRDEAALTDFLRFEPFATHSARMAVAALWAARRLDDAEREARALAAAISFPYASGDSALVAEVLSLVQYHDIDQDALLALYRTYDRIVRAELAAAGDSAPLAATKPRQLSDGNERLRIGYLSADFRAHVMGEILAPLLRIHDKERFAVHLYSLAPIANEDALSERLRVTSDAFVRLAEDDDAAAARRIAADDLDLLVDLMGHSAFSRPGIAARKPARVIVTHLGYHGSLGLSAVDYKMTDAVADLHENAAFQVEGLLPLGTCLLPLRPFRAPIAQTSRAELGIEPDAIVCATFVGAQKLSPRCLALWHEILQAVPNAILLFSPQRDDDRAALVRRLAGFGIAADRTRFIAYDRKSLRDRYAVVDLALDTLPYTGGDTTIAALSAGIPVATRAGIRHAERVSASILRHAGLADLVAESDQAYVRLAIRLATDDAFRSAQRDRIPAALSATTLTDPVTYTRALENAYIRALAEKHFLPF